MNIKPAQLLTSLRKDFKALVWIAGDEPLLLQESADAVRQFCRDEGFEEREIFNVDRNFDWNLFRETTANLGLFGDRKLIELRLAAARLEDPGKAALQAYVESPNPDYLILISSPRIDPSTLRTRWFKTLEASAWFVPVWPLSVEELPDWLGQRLLKYGLRTSPEALQLLVERVEGNLLAAVQEIEKLSLLAGKDSEDQLELNTEMVLQAVADSSRYNAFTLVDAALSGNARRSLKILQALKDEGVEPLAILGAVTNELRRLLPGLRQVEHGQSAARVSAEIVGKNFRRKTAVSRALQRLRSNRVYRLLDQARIIDASVKGLLPGDPWLELENLLLGLCGVRLPILHRVA